MVGSFPKPGKMNLRNSISKFLGRFAGALSALWITSLVLAQPAQPAQPRQFGIGAPRTLEEVPASRFQTDLEKLSPVARENARKWLSSFHFTDGDLPSLHTDANGGVCYACKVEHPHTTEEITAPEPDAPGVGAAAVSVSPFPASLKFHSRPGAPNVLFINFSGETVTDTEWNTVVGRDAIPAVAFSTDSDLTTFSDAEQAAIKRIWQRMAEDFSPFNINVTTERPATFNSRTAQALITRKTDANGALNPYSTAGGVAYVNVFGRTDFISRYSPAWVYHDNLSNSEALVAEAASHEIGHNLGLSHDGTSSSDYYGGHGSGEISWGPLMGTGYNRNVSQWSKGEYLNANNTQDDLTVIAGKISYRASDHGSTPGTATPLIITDGNKIVSTTPENDPSNATPANKGVLERTADVDVFSFVTGSGPVELTAKTWIQAAGTRGGNLDILLELYNEAGTFLASNNPATLTSATISTTLAEGRYYLYVKNSGAGSPLSSSPSGYTSYGSLGQYFISGSTTESTGFIVPPVAELQVTDLIASDQATKQFSVTYSDNVAIDVSTLGSTDIQVTGPGGYDQLAQWVSVSSNTNGTPRTATYSVTPSGGGTWSAAQNGTYIISMRSGEVADTEGAFVAAGELGQFKVAVPVAIHTANMDNNPGWTLQPQWEYGTPAYGNNSSAPSSGATGTKIIAYNLSGNYADKLAVTQYATTPQINCSGTTTLTLRFKRWLRTKNQDTASIQVSTNGTSWTTVWSTLSATSDSSWQTLQYTLPASVAGSATLQLRWGLSSNNSQNEIGWNIDDVELLGDGALDSSPPEALLSVADLTVGGSPSHSCSVTYNDDSAVRLSSLDSTDLLVTGPNVYSQFAEFIGADLSGDGSPITGSYSIDAPNGTWAAADNGTYTVTLQQDAVEDTLGNLTAEAVLGTFDVVISTAIPGTLTLTPAGDLNATGSVGGPFTPDSITYTLSNNGETALDWTAANTNDWVSLSASSGTLAAGASATVTVSINSAAANLPDGNHADIVNFVNTTDGNGNTSRSLVLEIKLALQFASVGKTAGGAFQMVILGPAGMPIVVEATVNLINWTSILTADIGENGSLTISDPDSVALPTRFYRVRPNP